MASHISRVAILSLLLRWRWTMETQVMWCHATIHQEKIANKKWLTVTKRYLPNVLFSFVEFLSQIFSRSLTGDLNHGQLLAIASHVAGRLTHTVIVVFLYQKVCGWSKPFKTRSWSQASHRRPFDGFCSISDRGDDVFATIVHFPWKQVMIEAITLAGLRDLLDISRAETRHKSS